MSRTPRRVGARRRPRVVVIGNHKGGSGKTTLAMHIVVALLKDGKAVASFDMDRRQQTLTRYIENRRAFTAQTGLALELPHHYPVAAESGEDDGALLQHFFAQLKRIERMVDVVVIDTPAGDDHLSLLAHGMADLLVTPINDSFVDLDAIMRIGPLRQFEPSCYAATVAAARNGRRKVSSRGSIDWVVVRNRLAPGSTAMSQGIAEVLEQHAATIGYRTAPGLSERLVFRAFFPIGATAFDALEDAQRLGESLMAQLLARMEMRELLETIGLVAAPPEGGAFAKADQSGAPAKSALRLPPAATLEEPAMAAEGAAKRLLSSS